MKGGKERPGDKKTKREPTRYKERAKRTHTERQRQR